MAIDESMDEVAKVPELFRSRLKERRSPACAVPESLATVATTTRVEAASHPGWVRVSLPSLSPKKWIDDVKNRIKGRVTAWVVEWDGCPAWLTYVPRRCMICGLLRGTQIRSWISAPVSFVVVLVTDEDLVSSHYVCVSLTEDQCGVVQRDIPKILEAIARFLGEVDKWHAEISADSSLTVTAASVDSSPASSATTTTADPPQRQKPISNQDPRVEEEWVKANVILTDLSNGLRESIGRITCTFGDKSMVFRFPPAVASGVQAFMDYC